MGDTLVVDKSATGDASKAWIDTDKYGGAIVILVLFMAIVSVVYCRDGFTSPDGVVARKDNHQVRSDTQVDRTWNLEQLEKSVALLNRKV